MDPSTQTVKPIVSYKLGIVVPPQFCGDQATYRREYQRLQRELYRRTHPEAVEREREKARARYHLKKSQSKPVGNT